MYKTNSQTVGAFPRMDPADLFILLGLSGILFFSGCNCLGEWRYVNSEGALRSLSTPADSLSLGRLHLLLTEHRGETQGVGISWQFVLDDSGRDVVKAEIREGVIPFEGRVVFEFPRASDTDRVPSANAPIFYEGPLSDGDFYELVLHNNVHVEFTLREVSVPELGGSLARQEYRDWEEIQCD